jgi:hypothetical protein
MTEAQICSKCGKAYTRPGRHLKRCGIFREHKRNCKPDGKNRGVTVKRFKHE